MKTKSKFIFAILLGFASNLYAKDGDVVSRDNIQSLSSASITVGSLTCNITGSTRFQGMLGETLNITDFAVGDFVKLSCRSGNAKEVELEDDHSSGSGSDDSSSSGSDDSNGSSDDSSHDSSSDDNSDHDSGDDSKSEHEKLKSKLGSTIGSNSLARAKVTYRNKTKKNKTDRRFTVNLKIPQSSTQLYEQSGSISSLSLELQLSRTAVAYSTCDLVFNGFDDNGRAEYKLDVRHKRNKVIFKKGNCDVDLSNSSSDDGVPEIDKGDNIGISDSFVGEFLSGDF